VETGGKENDFGGKDTQFSLTGTLFAPGIGTAGKTSDADDVASANVFVDFPCLRTFGILDLGGHLDFCTLSHQQ
jgi:hypothetical protein